MDPQEEEQQAIIFDTKLGSELIEQMSSPELIEQRNETVMSIGALVGIEEARVIVDASSAKTRAILAIFAEDRLSAGARYFLDAMLRQWLLFSRPWDDLTAAHAASLGKTPEEVAAKAVKIGVAPTQEPPVPPAEAAGVPMQMRLGYHLAFMENEAQLNGADDQTHTEFYYARFRDNPNTPRDDDDDSP